MRIEILKETVNEDSEITGVTLTRSQAKKQSTFSL